MKKTLEEQVRIKLLKIGKKNKVCRYLVIPILTTAVFFFHICAYLKNNRKRLLMTTLTFSLFVVYSSFSFPLFSINTTEDTFLYDKEEQNVFFAAEEEFPMENIVLLDDEDVLEDTETSAESTSHGMDIVDKYEAEEILESIEERKSQIQQSTKEETNIEKGVFSKDDWRLVLINKQHPIPEDYTFQLGTIMDSMQCDERILDDLFDMLQAAKEEGISLIVCSPYRDMARQEMLFNRKINRYMKNGMSYLEAYQLSSQAVTVPGASEHQIGLALDIVCNEYTSLDEGFGETEAGIWLRENSYQYGFILRYPLGKEYITGIEYEPWHFRYVGVEAATVITQKGITLEEFWEELE